MTGEVPTVVVLAHDAGGSFELPFPTSFAVIGTVWAVTATYVALWLGWKRPRFDPARPGHPLPGWVTRVIDSPVTQSAAAGLFLLFAGWVAVATSFAPHDGRNPLPGAVFVLLWVGLIPASLAAGPVWRVISPARTVVRVAAVVRDGAQSVRTGYPAGWGYWPAALGLFSFVWLQTASPNFGTLAAIKFWLLAYIVAMLGGAILFGRTWFARADPFEVYSVVVSRMSPFCRNGSREVAVGNPMDRLLSMPVRPATVTVLAMLLGAVFFDSFSALEPVENFIYDQVEVLPLGSQFVGGTILRTVGLVMFIVIVAVSFWVAARATGGVDCEQRRRLPGRMAHALIPLIVAYTLAHHLADLVERGQETIILLTDPLGLGWDPLRSGIGDVNYWLSLHPVVLSAIELSCIVIGHVVATVAVHDTAIRSLPARHRRSGQVAMLLTMVGYAFAGVYLLTAV